MNDIAISNYRRLRASLIERGVNLRRFAIQHGYSTATVYNAARGERCGIKSIEILKKLKELAYGQSKKN